jgi:hypothetical protein
MIMISRTQSRLQAACMRVLAVDLLPPGNCPKAPQRSQACATCRELQVARHGLPQHACTVYKSCVAVCACTIARTLRAYLHSLSKGTRSHYEQHRQISAPEHNTTYRTYMHHMQPLEPGVAYVQALCSCDRPGAPCAHSVSSSAVL